MLAGLLCACVLAAALVVVRASPRSSRAGESFDPRGGAPWEGHGNSPKEVTLGALVVLVLCLPLVHVAPWIGGNAPTSWGDDATHARIASDVARHGLPHGWIGSYMGGFPFAHHYPPAGWLASAALVALGVSAQGATSLLGTLGVVGAAWSMYHAAIGCGARLPVAVVGAAVVAWVSPYSPFVGGYEVFFHLGLLSQALAAPLCVLLAAGIARARTPWPPVLLAAIAMAVHPQLVVATLAVSFLAVAAAGHRPAFVRFVRASLAAGAAGLALYGQGIRSLELPFGWPPNREWLQLGYPPERLGWWLLDGDLLDRGRVPVLTAMAAAAALALLFLVRRPAARAALVAAAAVLVLSVSGVALTSAGRLGAFVLGFLQPLRVVALAPFVAAALVVVALEEGAPRVLSSVSSASSASSASSESPVSSASSASSESSASSVSPWKGYVARLALALLPAVVLLALPSRAEYAASLGALVKRLPSAPCGPDTPEGYDRAGVRALLAPVGHARVWYPQDDSPLRACAIHDGLELAIPGPVAIAGGAGSHVGTHWVAFRKLDLERSGSARRAEALGVRYVLRMAPPGTGAAREIAPPPEGWTLVGASGPIQLLEAGASVATVGAGCIRARWSGDDRALRAAVEQRLAQPGGPETLLSPDELVALVADRGPLRVEDLRDVSGCDASAAVVEEHAREPGVFAALVSSPSPVDVVVRATAFPSWRVAVDGEALAPGAVTRVAPGFFSVRVGAGRHHVVATAGTLPGYWLGLLLAFVFVLGCGAVDRTHLARVRTAFARR